MAKQRATRPELDPAQEYIDSGLMSQRLKHGRRLSARIEGNYGVYRTRARLGRGGDGHCTCPSDWSPCKHVRALKATWEVNPTSFFDLDVFLGELSAKSKADLIKLIARVIAVAPEGLAACGFSEFEPERDRDDTE